MFAKPLGKLVAVIVVMLVLGPASSSLAAAPIAKGHQPQLASLAAEAGTVYLTFGDGETLFFARSGDAGRTFSDPMMVGTVPHLMLGMRRGPRIAVTRDAMIIAAIGQETGNLVAFRSPDHGRSWQPEASPINDAPKSAREGLHALASDGEDSLVAVWLDLRANQTQLYASLSADSGATWSRNILLYASPAGHICECCHPSAIFLPDGRIAVLFRNFDGVNRDMYLLTFTPGKEIPAPVQLDASHWPLNACPMDGGSLTVSTRGEPVAAYRRQSAIYAASPDLPEKRIAITGSQPAAGGDDVAYLSSRHTGPLWVEHAGSPPRKLAEDATDPVLLQTPAGAVVAYESDNHIFTIGPLDTRLPARKDTGLPSRREQP